MRVRPRYSSAGSDVYKGRRMTDALSPCSSRGRATAASAWENLPMTRPYDNCRRYSPLGRWFASLQMTDARCPTAASTALMWGAAAVSYTHLRAHETPAHPV